MSTLISARRLSLLALALSAVIGATAQAQTVASPVVVKDYDVFVDPPTAFAFIKLPTGWKFVGKLDAEQLRDLPPGTLTSLLPAGDDDAATRLAAAPAKQQQVAPKKKS
jgi:hypothetical protein